MDFELASRHCFHLRASSRSWSLYHGHNRYIEAFNRGRRGILVPGPTSASDIVTAPAPSKAVAEECSQSVAERAAQQHQWPSEIMGAHPCQPRQNPEGQSQPAEQIGIPARKASNREERANHSAAKRSMRDNVLMF